MLWMCPFQSTRPRGARPTTTLVACLPPYSFNPRARVGRDLHAPRARAGKGVFQSTRPRGARPYVWVSYCKTQVSIHAPAWGATCRWPHGARWATVSIHAPAWGATTVGAGPGQAPNSFNPRARVGRDGGAPCEALAGRSFNPRARVGRDLGVPARRPLIRRVSIHAPAWGATRIPGGSATINIGFQSTRPRGARRRQACRKGHLARVSIHAPAWGATGRWSVCHGGSGVSIHAPAWGATMHDETSVTCIRGFNPRARVGRDPLDPDTQQSGASFNPRARVGRDPPSMA